MTPRPFPRLVTRAEQLQAFDAFEAVFRARRLDLEQLRRVVVLADVRLPRRPRVSFLDRGRFEADARHELAPRLAAAVASPAPPERLLLLVRGGSDVEAFLVRFEPADGSGRIFYTSPGGDA